MSNKYFKTTGIIIRKFDFNEADRIVTVLTADRGKIDCIAKGARRFRSKFCGRLELFYTVELNCFQGRSLASINEIHVIESFTEERDLEKHRVLFYLAEITHKLVQEGQQIEGVYRLLQDTLFHLKQSDKHEVLLHSYLTKLLTYMGFLSPWNQCATCNISLNRDQLIHLSAVDANVVCMGCKKPGDQLIELPQVKWVNFMQRYALEDVLRVKVEEREHRMVWRWLQRVLSGILSKPLKSQEFLTNV